MARQFDLRDTSPLPTTSLLFEMLVVVCLISGLSWVTYGLRMYSRITSKQLGLGKHNCAVFDLDIFCVGMLTIGLYRGLVDDCRHGLLPVAAQKSCFVQTAEVSQIFSIPLTCLQFLCTTLLAHPSEVPPGEPSIRTP